MVACPKVQDPGKTVIMREILWNAGTITTLKIIPANVPVYWSHSMQLLFLYQAVFLLHWSSLCWVRVI